MKSCKDTITRKFDVKDLYFEDDKLMTVIKEEDPQEVNLIEDLKSLFGDNIFNLIDAIVAKNKSKAYSITQDLINKGEDISKIIIMVSDQFRLMYQVKSLLKEGFNQDFIASKLKIHPYRVKLAIEKGYNYSSKTLLTNLDYFFNLDYMIKSGNNNPKLVFELFLANL